MKVERMTEWKNCLDDMKALSVNVGVILQVLVYKKEERSGELEEG